MKASKWKVNESKNRRSKTKFELTLRIDVGTRTND